MQVSSQMSSYIQLKKSLITQKQSQKPNETDSDDIFGQWVATELKKFAADEKKDKIKKIVNVIHS